MKGVLSHHRIRIQQQHIFSLRLTDGLIIGFGKSEVLLIFYQSDPRILFTHGHYTIIVGVVIHHKNLTLDSFKGFLYALQTLFQIAAHIIADDDNTQFHASVSASQRLSLG